MPRSVAAILMKTLTALEGGVSLREGCLSNKMQSDYETPISFALRATFR